MFFPSTGPDKFVISPLGATTDWKFIAWMRLCLLNNALWLLVGLHIDRTVPSTKPQQLSKAAPLACTVLENSSKLGGESQIC